MSELRRTPSIEDEITQTLLPGAPSLVHNLAAQDVFEILQKIKPAFPSDEEIGIAAATYFPEVESDDEDYVEFLQLSRTAFAYGALWSRKAMGGGE